MSAFQKFDHISHLVLPSELDFDPVREQAVRVNKRGDIESLRGIYNIINPLNDSVLCQSRKNHTPLNYSIMWSSFMEGLVASGIDLNQVEAKWNIASDGRSFTCDIILKRYNYEMQVGEPVYMRFRIADSHDMTMVRDILCGLWRLFCANGCSAVSEQLRVREKHTSGSDPERMGAVVADYPKRLQAEAELYPLMMAQRVPEERAMNFIEQNIVAYKNNAGRMVTNKTELAECYKTYNLYSSMGETAYRLYNTLTHIGTHVTGREGTNLTLKQANRERMIQTVINRKEFKELAGLPLAA